MVTSHSVTLSGLTAGSAYHFRVHSKDSAGNSAQSGDVTFTTASPTASAIATTGPTYYVATTGIDANPGTEAQPFRTVSHGVSVLTPGDTLYVKSGTYAEALIHSIPPGATWDRPVTVAAAPGHTVTLRPPPGSEFVLRFIGPQAYIIVRGFILDAVNVTYDAVKITAGPTYVPAHHIRIEDCEIANSRSGHGVLITGDGADFNEILNCRIHHNGNDLAGGSPNHGIYAQSDHNLFEGNDIHDHHEGYGIHLFNASQSFNIVRKNAIHDNVDQLLVTGQGNSVYNNLLWGRGWAIAVCSSSGRCDGNMIYHNTTYATLVGIAVRDTATSTLVQNNIVQQSGGYPDDSIINFGHGTVIQHNLMDRGITNFGSNATIAHNIVGHAWFISAAAHDFRLQPSSPAINAGMTVSLVTEDFEGTPRPQGGSYDIGAFEYSE